MPRSMQRIDKGRGEVQPRGRRRDRAGLAGEHRLVTLAVDRHAAPRPLDIGRQRHRAMPREGRAERLALDVEAQLHGAIRLLGDDFGREALGEFDAVAGMQPPRAFGIGLPAPAAEIVRQGDLDRRRAAPADQPRRDHLGVVAHQQIARPQQVGQVGDLPVCEPARRRHHQQPRGIARLGRAVGDQLARQVEVEIGKAHHVSL